LPLGVSGSFEKIAMEIFKIYQHTRLWQFENAKDISKGFGVIVVKTWYWYESWLNFVRNHCEQNKLKYT
jgi:hypothetical protein